MFVSPHCLVDFTNGAATATLDALSLLTQSGFECQAFCGSRTDACEEILVEEILARRRERYTVRNANLGPYTGRIIFTSHGDVPITLFNAASTRGCWASPEEIAAFLTGCHIFLQTNRPDLVWTYGGDPVSIALHRLLKRIEIPVVFALHNFSYTDPATFRLMDHVIVPTEIVRHHYAEKLGLAPHRLPLTIDPQRVVAAAPAPKYVTFVNPTALKGVFIFARIAELLSKRRPDIPMLLVESVAKANTLSVVGVDLGRVANLRVMPNASDPREFYRETKLLLMPSLLESAGMVAMEAMSNGIPVLASNRGALPETIGDAGFVFDIPSRYTRETREAPTEKEVEPWVETIIRLWDDAAEYERWSRAALAHAQQWHPDRLGPVYREFFRSITRQPGRRLVPAEPL